MIVISSLPELTYRGPERGNVAVADSPGLENLVLEFRRILQFAAELRNNAGSRNGCSADSRHYSPSRLLSMFRTSPLNALLRGRGYRVLGGLCLLAVGLLGTPKSAQASCGDYLAHPSHPMPASHAAQMDSRPESNAPLSPRPCNGPSCRRSDAPMPVPSPAPIRLLGERWATIFEFELVLPSAATQFPALTEELCLSAFPARLDRPPKIG